MRILFRCDGGRIPEIGTGHIVRCLLLAGRLKEEGHEIGFAIARDEWGLQKIKDSKYPTFQLPKDASGEEAGLTKAIKSFGTDVVVVDRLDTSKRFMATIKRATNLLMTLDNRGTGAPLADLLINGMIRGGDTPYRGYDYVVLPPRKIRKKKILKECKKVFIAFGGYDHLGLVPKAFEAAQSFSRSARFTVVSGNKNGESNGKGVPDSLQGRLRVFKWVKDLDPLVENSDLAILSGGLSLYQALSFGVPSLVISQYPHQLETAEKLAKDNAAVNLGSGSELAPEGIQKAARQLLSDYSQRVALSKKAQSLIDRNGLHRVTRLIQVVKFLQWDTRFFKKRIARLYPFRINERIVKFAFRFCGREKIDCLYYLADCHDPKSVGLAEKYGFHFVDTRLTLGIDLEKGAPHRQRPESKGITLREFKKADLPFLKKISETSYRSSRYYFDGHFSRDLCAKFYSEWITKSCRGSSEKVFVAVSEEGPVGYLTCERDDFLRGRFSLVGVHEKFQSRGVGRLLVQKGLEWFRGEGVRFVQVVTQGRNYGAQRLYQRSGFVTEKSEIWYHKWFRG